MSAITTSSLNVAVIGSGPAGFYAVIELLKQEDPRVKIDLFEALPTPYGLVRYGVAPDHENIRKVTQTYDKAIEANLDRFRFFGHVVVGRDIQFDELRAHYHAVIVCTGAQSDRQLGVPGEELPGVYAAREFVAWYNGHPQMSEARFSLTHPRAIVIGVGNVALDVGRILLRSEAELLQTDISDRALSVLTQSRVDEVLLLGRRGPLQAACTPVEIRELARMERADLVMEERDLILDPVSTKLIETKGATPQQIKNHEQLKSLSLRERRPDRGMIQFRFYSAPEAFLGDGKLEAVRVRRNRVELDASGRENVVPTDVVEEIPCGVVFRSIGYQVAPAWGLPYDTKRSVIANDKGHVVTVDTRKPLDGVFVAGWAKRGPTGIIGTNKPDAIETVETLLAAHRNGQLPSPSRTVDINTVLSDRGVRVVHYADWKKLNQAEIARASGTERPRRKFTTIEEMLNAISV